MIIYLITNSANGKMYVGRTVQSLERRWNRHKSHARRRKNFHLYNAMNKHGLVYFTIKVLSEHSTEEELNAAEMRWIKELNTTDSVIGYNMTAGGDGQSGYTHTAETKQKIGAKSKDRPVSEATKSAVSLAHKGKPKPLEQRLKMAAHWNEDRRDQQGEVAKRVNAIENAKLKDYTCDLCRSSFTQVKKGVFGGHRKACMRVHGVQSKSL